MPRLGWTGPESIGGWTWLVTYDAKPAPDLPVAPIFLRQTRTRGKRDEPQE